MIQHAFHNLGIVLIGRNEGDRLKRCIASIVPIGASAVYVDSGSADDSIANAVKCGIDVVVLDSSKPFTAARARNAGLKRLLELRPHVEFVQFVDGDCELNQEWMPKAMKVMAAQPRVAVVCGRRRERSPGSSIYNRLCDMEWNTPIGEARWCGGDALIRIQAIREVGGYSAHLIAGEEPDLCLRLRQRQWTVARIDAEMTLHDANIQHFSQWWRRMVRSGYACAERHWTHRSAMRADRDHSLRSILQWTLIIPLAALMFVWVTWGASLTLFLLYALLWKRVRGHRLRAGDSANDAQLYANYCIVGKFAEVLGVMQFWGDRVLGRKSLVIEYKSKPTPAAIGVQEVST